MFERELVTIHLEEREARIAVFQGALVTRWASAPVPSGVIVSGRVEQPEALGPLLLELLSQIGTRSVRPYVSLSGIHAVVRRPQLPRLKKNLLPEAIRGEMVREVPSALEHYQLHWVQLESSRTESRFYVMAVPTSELESFIGAFRDAGLRPRKIILEAGAFASLLDEGDNIVISLKEQGFSVIDIRNGTPVAFQDIDYSRESMSLDEKMVDLSRELQLTLDSMRSNDPDREAQSTYHTYLVGKYAGDAVLVQRLSREVGFEPARIELGREIPEDFPIFEYAANLGLSYNARGGNRWFGATRPNQAFDLNIAGRGMGLAPFARGAVFLAAVLALAPAVNPLLGVMEPYPPEQELRAQISQLQTSMEETRARLKTAREAEAQRIRTEADANRLDTQLQEIAGRRLDWPAAILNSRAAFPNIEVLSFSESDRELRISAIAPNADQVVAFTSFLSSSPDLGKVIVTSMAGQESEDGLREFRFELIADKEGNLDATS